MGAETGVSLRPHAARGGHASLRTTNRLAGIHRYRELHESLDVSNTLQVQTHGPHVLVLGGVGEEINLVHADLVADGQAVANLRVLERRLMSSFIIAPPVQASLTKDRRGPVVPRGERDEGAIKLTGALTIPMGVRPVARMPLDRTRAASSASNTAPSPLTSPKPAVMITPPRTPRSMHPRKASTVASRGTTRNARSIASRHRRDAGVRLPTKDRLGARVNWIHASLEAPQRMLLSSTWPALPVSPRRRRPPRNAARAAAAGHAFA